MPQAVQFSVQMPEDLAGMQLPPMHRARLQALLDKQDSGTSLTADEQREAEELVQMSELFSLLRMRAERVSGKAA